MQGPPNDHNVRDPDWKAQCKREVRITWRAQPRTWPCHASQRAIKKSFGWLSFAGSKIIACALPATFASLDKLRVSIALLSFAQFLHLMILPQIVNILGEKVFAMGDNPFSDLVSFYICTSLIWFNHLY